MGDEWARGRPPRRDEGARALCFLMALVGIFIVASPVGFHSEPSLVLLLRVGSGLAVIALALYFYLAI